MRLSLDWVPVHNQWALFGIDLAGDEGFDATRPLPFEGFEERRRFNRVVKDKADAIHIVVFNQQTWPQKSGWEYWTFDDDKILAHAEAVAQELGLKLEVGLVYG